MPPRMRFRPGLHYSIEENGGRRYYRHATIDQEFGPAGASASSSVLDAASLLDAASQLALHNAAATGDKEQVVRLLDAGCDIDANSDSTQMTPLHRSAECGHEEVIRELLARGAGLLNKTAKGNTALHLAAQAGHLEALRLLVRACCRHGVSIYSLLNYWGLSPIEVACQGRKMRRPSEDSAVTKVIRDEMGSAEALWRADRAPAEPGSDTTVLRSC